MAVMTTILSPTIWYFQVPSMGSLRGPSLQGAPGKELTEGGQSLDSEYTTGLLVPSSLGPGLGDLALT